MRKEISGRESGQQNVNKLFHSDNSITCILICSNEEQANISSKVKMARQFIKVHHDPVVGWGGAELIL